MFVFFSECAFDNVGMSPWALLTCYSKTGKGSLFAEMPKKRSPGKTQSVLRLNTPRQFDCQQINIQRLLLPSIFPHAPVRI